MDFLLIIFFSLQFYNSFGILESEWLSICLGESKKYLIYDTSSCNSGFYFKSPLRDFCVCAKGVWLLKPDYCSDYIIIDGSGGQCFKIEKSIKYIKYIGVTHDPYAEFNFVSDDKFASITELHKIRSRAGYTYVGTVNPRRPIGDCNGQICYDGKLEENDPSSPSSRFYFGPISKEDGMEIKKTCEGDDGFSQRTSYPYRLFQNGILDSSKGYNPEGIQNSSLKLCHSCLPHRKTVIIPPNGNGIVELNNDTILPTTTTTTTTTTTIKPDDVSIIISTTKRPSTTSKRPKKAKFSLIDADTVELFEQEQNCSSRSSSVLLHTPSERIRKDIGSQTVSMINAYYSSTILGKELPLVNLTEFVYLQSSRLIFEKVCPDTEVPHVVLRSLLLMFRVALNHSLESYPYMHIGDKEEDTRLQQGLDACLEHAKKIDYVFKYNKTGCPAKFEEVSVKDEKGTLHPVNSSVPCNIAYDSSHLDYSVEATWKMVMFSHYFCAKHFNSSAYDHSRLKHKLRQFFNKAMIQRWYHPDRAGDAIDKIFKKYDMKKFKQGIDRCVAVAKNRSPFSTWIKRPKMEPIRQSIRKEKANVIQKLDFGMVSHSTSTFINGTGYCLHTPNQLFDEGILSLHQGFCRPKPHIAGCSKNITYNGYYNLICEIEGQHPQNDNNIVGRDGLTTRDNEYCTNSNILKIHSIPNGKNRYTINTLNVEGMDLQFDKEEIGAYIFTNNGRVAIGIIGEKGERIIDKFLIHKKENEGKWKIGSESSNIPLIQRKNVWFRLRRCLFDQFNPNPLP